MAVHSNSKGNPSGLEYRIVTSPVSASFESVKSQALCSLEIKPYCERPPRRIPRPDWESIVITLEACAGCALPHSDSTLSQTTTMFALPSSDSPVTTGGSPGKLNVKPLLSFGRSPLSRFQTYE